MKRLTRYTVGPALLLSITFLVGCSPKTIKKDDISEAPAVEERADEKKIEAEAQKKPEQSKPVEEEKVGLTRGEAASKDEAEEGAIEGKLPEEKPIVEEPSIDVTVIEEISQEEDAAAEKKIDIEKAMERAVEKALKEFIARAEKERKDMEAAQEERTRAGKIVASLPKEEVLAAEAGNAEGIDLRTVYFDFDKYSIKEDSKEALRKNAEWLVNHPTVKLLIEGHADERGPNEYNLALGEKRVISVITYLLDLGAKVEISKISYGEEKPLCLEYEEECWARNRRVEFMLIAE